MEISQTMIKSLFLTFLLILSFNAFSQDHRKIIDSLERVVVEEHELNLDNDGKPDKILLKEPPYGDPGQFNSYEIILSSGQQISEKPYGLDFAEEIEFGLKNRVKSNLVYIPEYSNKTYVFFFGYQYGCCLKQLICYEIKERQIDKIYSSELQVSRIGDFNNDGKLNIEGVSNKSEIWSSSTVNATFRRMSFEKVFNVEDTLQLNKQLTYDRHPADYTKFGAYLDIEAPVLVSLNGKEFLETFKNVDQLYNRMFQFASSTKIRNAALHKYSRKELRLMRNEIFAAHGYIFKSNDLKKHFGSTKWYNPRFSNVDDKLTEIEKFNIQQILEIEKTKSP